MRMQHCVAITQALSQSHKFSPLPGKAKGVACYGGSEPPFEPLRGGQVAVQHFMSCLHSLPNRSLPSPLKNPAKRVRILKTAIKYGQCLQFANYRESCESMRQVAAPLIYIIKFLFYN